VQAVERYAMHEVNLAGGMYPKTCAKKIERMHNICQQVLIEGFIEADFTRHS
jgi:hypothetical protein